MKPMRRRQVHISHRGGPNAKWRGKRKLWNNGVAREFFRIAAAVSEALSERDAYLRERMGT